MSEINLLTERTRGLRRDDIDKVANEYLRTGKVPYKPDHPTNTCDPYTGSWTERLIDLKRLKEFIRGKNLSVKISNSYYAYSGNRLSDFVKYILNQVIKVSGERILFISPAITLEIQKKGREHT